jgi:CO/xanthine dehydrogenase FAD-binding subunit
LTTLVVPGGLGEALDILGDVDSGPIAGGIGVALASRANAALPGRLVRVRDLPELRVVRGTDPVEIGAALTFSEAIHASLVRDQVPLLAAVLAQAGTPAVRNAATLGGNLALGNPASDLLAALVALDAEVVVASLDGERVVAGADLPGVHGEITRPGHLAVRICVPNLRDAGWSVRRLTAFGRSGPVVATVIVVVRDGATGLAARVVVGGTSRGPLAFDVAEPLTEAIDSALAGTEWPSDAIASAWYRGRAIPPLVARGLAEARQRMRS